MNYARTLAMAVAIVAGTGMAAGAAPINGTLDSVSGGGPYTWTYDAVLNGQSRVGAGGDFFIADFDGYLDGSSFALADWSGTAENQASVLLDQFGARSIYDDEMVGFWSAQGNSQLNPVAAAMVHVPEAGILAMLGLGLIGAGVTARRRP